ncbi:MAG: NUDIX hydrolase [Limnospira sp.]
MARSQLPWDVLSRFVEIRSPWLTLIGEKLRDNRSQILEYWRVEKADSAVILTIENNQLVLPVAGYRPGLGEATLDFPGGRVPADREAIDVVPQILERELGVAESEILKIESLNDKGWAVNSSFSNQKLYGFVAKLLPDYASDRDKIGATYPMTSEGIAALLRDLTCLQCRAVLLEWMRSQS